MSSTKDSEYTEFDYKRWRLIGIVAITFAVVLIVIVILLLIFVIAPQTAQNITVPYVAPPVPLIPLINIQPGGTCTNPGSCAPG